MTTTEVDTVDRRGWHVGKEIPIALVLALVAQTVGFIWSIAGLYNRVDNLTGSMQEMRQERYTKEDARRDREAITQWVDSQRQRDFEQDRRLNTVEAMVQQMWRSK